MKSVQFIRTAHDQNGRWHPFSPTATAFWQQHCGVIGIQLRHEQPLSFTQLLIGCNEYADEHVTDGNHPERNRGYVAWVLVHLLQWGMAAIIALPHSTDNGLELGDGLSASGTSIAFTDCTAMRILPRKHVPQPNEEP